MFKPKETMKKVALLTAALAFGGLLRAQNPPPASFTFNHLALSVKDVNRSAEFYKNVLQLQEITNRSEIPGIRWFSLGEGKELHLISIIPEDVTINKAVHLALVTADLKDFVKTLDALKIPYSDWPGKPHTINRRADGIEQIFFQDPDDYWIEVNTVPR
jgi:lactoylglutathione lyase